MSEFVGLLPCAGRAERMMGLPKFLLPVGDTYLLKWHLEQMVAAGSEINIVIPNSENRELIRLHCNWLEFVPMPVSTSTLSETLRTVRKECGNRQVIMTLPDTFIYGNNIQENLPDLLQKLNRHPDWDAAVLAFQLNPWQVGRLGLLELDDRNVVKHVHDKDATRTTGLIWGAAVWRPSFWEYIEPEHKHLGLAFEAARTGVIMGSGTFYDCGTPEEYYRLCARFHKEREVINQ